MFEGIFIVSKKMNQKIISNEDLENICRICLQRSKDRIDLFSSAAGFSMISEAVMECAPIQISYDDKLPHSICQDCVTQLEIAYRFRVLCVQSDLTLHQLVSQIDNEFKNDSHEFKDSGSINFNGNETENKIKEEVPTGDSDNDVKSSDSFFDETTEQPSPKPVTARKTRAHICIKCSSRFTQKHHLQRHQKRCLAGKIKRKKLQLPTGENEYKLKNENIDAVDDELKNENEYSENDNSQDTKENSGKKKNLAVRRIVCSVCGKLVIASHIGVHMRIHTEQKSYKCTVCEKEFNLGQYFRRHMMTHTVERSHQCNTCGKCFRELHYLRVHMRTHTGEKPYECSNCGRKFTIVGNLRRHMRIHTGERPYQCNICGKGFIQLGSLQEHKVTHTNETPYECNGCGKRFKSKTRLRNHGCCHTGNKPYTCEQCNKSFPNLGSLKVHSFIHTGEKPYSCHLCNKKFRQRPQLQTHLRTHDGSKPFKCSFCDKCFALNGNLKVHIRRHTGETPFECSVCGRGFYDSSSMKKHKRTHKE